MSQIEYNYLLLCGGVDEAPGASWRDMGAPGSFLSSDRPESPSEIVRGLMMKTWQCPEDVRLFYRRDVDDWTEIAIPRRRGFVPGNDGTSMIAVEEDIAAGDKVAFDDLGGLSLRPARADEEGDGRAGGDLEAGSRAVVDRNGNWSTAAPAPRDAREQGFVAGQRAVYLEQLVAALRGLGYEDTEATRARWVNEREQTVAFLRSLCAERGDNDWDDKLHLRDVLEKHLWRYLDLD